MLAPVWSTPQAHGEWVESWWPYGARLPVHTDESGVFTKKNFANRGKRSMRIRTRLIFFGRQRVSWQSRFAGNA
jgi:hypothetical protein